MSKLVRWAAWFVLSTCLISNAVAPASANHVYDGLVPTRNYAPVCFARSGPTDPNNSVCQTDNSTVGWYADSNDPAELEANDRDALSAMLEAQFEPTDLSIFYDSSPVFSGSGETDWVYQETDTGFALPTGVLGVAWCDDDVNGLIYDCDQTYVRITAPDGYRIEGGSVACHEAGHQAGLVHGNNASLTNPPHNPLDAGDARLGCMENEDEFPRTLGAASQHLINGEY